MFISSHAVLIEIISITVVSRVSTHGHLNITHDFGLHGRLPGIRSCYNDPLKWGTWALTLEWALARDTTVLF